ncbi:hypothetical protein ALQ04_02711 [Pseudomonas cichorii]|uniref:Uncharacterized protein n=1 Tax=Pseudomonas cichorii TaxID=36746 RepID=A0A3M4M2X4_PSECI|nr:hypothetical protein [Pseudomonas cichorii]RMQ48059.1 hypothetical protein ALQ04_02711 [Pseudomonas cichorii]
MSIQNKDWNAHLNTMPGTEGPKLVVSGVVTVPTSVTEATLVLSPRQDKSLGLRLDLHMEDKGIGLPALTDKTVSYSQPAAGYDVTHVTIYYKEEKLAVIDKIEVVS